MEWIRQLFFLQFSVFGSIVFPFNPGPVRSLLEEIVDNYREARSSAERSGYPEHIPYIEINIRLSAASIRSRRTDKHKMKDILHYLSRRGMYYLTLYFQEIVPITGHYDIYEFMVYTKYRMYVWNVNKKKVVVVTILFVVTISLTL